ncbi:MAG: PIN domain-containing protein [Candidatus Methanoperedens sp.]|nr:PIN domain-containing protein [Candidatus Methanoperedens sp.]
MKKILVDSNIFIFANIKEYPEHPLAKAKLKQLIEDHKLIINAIIISEVQYKLFRLLDKEESFLRTNKILTSSYVEYEPIGYDTVLKASELSYKSNFRINDALIAQHAIDLHVESIFTDNVKDFEKILDLKIIPLRA